MKLTPTKQKLERMRAELERALGHPATDELFGKYLARCAEVDEANETNKREVKDNGHK